MVFDPQDFRRNDRGKSSKGDGSLRFRPDPERFSMKLELTAEQAMNAPVVILRNRHHGERLLRKWPLLHLEDRFQAVPFVSFKFAVGHNFTNFHLDARMLNSYQHQKVVLVPLGPSLTHRFVL